MPQKLGAQWGGMEETRSTRSMTGWDISGSEFASRREGARRTARFPAPLVRAGPGTSKPIRKMLKENAGKPPAYPADDSVLTVRGTALPLDRMTEAPEVAHPKGSYGKEEILRLAAQAREATRDSLTMLAGADPRSVEFPHPFFGSMNLYEWPRRIIQIGRAHV